MAFKNRVVITATTMRVRVAITKETGRGGREPGAFFTLTLTFPLMVTVTLTLPLAPTLIPTLVYPVSQSRAQTLLRRAEILLQCSPPRPNASIDACNHVLGTGPGSHPQTLHSHTDTAKEGAREEDRYIDR